MYFLKQINKQIQHTLCSYNQESGPWSYDFDPEALAREAPQREAEAARPEAERLKEADADITETTAQMRTRMEWMRAEQGRIARAEAITAIGGPEWDPASILKIAPASASERYAAMAALQTAWVEITDETLDRAIIEARWEGLAVERELDPEEQREANRQALASASAEVDIEVVVLQNLYDFAHEGSDISDVSPEDIIDFANQMERLRLLTERTEWMEMPVTQEEFDRLMEHFRWEDGRLHIPLTDAEINEMWLSIDDEGNITLRDWTTYWPDDVPPGMPYISDGRVSSWYRGWARLEGGRSYGYESDIDINNLPSGVEWLMEYIVHEEAWGSYDRLYNKTRITPPQPITQMSVWDVRQFQNQMVREQNARGINPASSAVGGLQIIRWTLDEMISAWVVNRNDTFNRETQHRLMLALLVEDGLDRYRWGQLSKGEFMANIAGTWASFPVDASGRWAHDGDAAWNRAYADATVVSRLLDEIAQSGSETPTVTS